MRSITRSARRLGFGFSQRQSRRQRQRTRTKLTVERLECRALLSADLVAFRPVTEYIDYSKYAVAETVETDPRFGPGIRFNGDNDNGTGGADYLDTGPTPLADHDLVRVDVKGTGQAFAISYDNRLAVWTTQTKVQPVASGSAVQANQQLWVEYVSPVHGQATMTLTVDQSTDSVVFHSFQSVVIAIGGRAQDPKYFGDPLLGTFTMAAQLYQQGYDVHMYRHDQIQSSSTTIGQGAAYNEVVNGVLNRNVKYVAAFGYSWGGSATYELSKGLSLNSSLAGKYELTFTAYIDAITHNGLSAERRLPVGTKYHDNFYQRRDWLLRGDSVPGANRNLNVTQTAWGARLTHTTIDDNFSLQNLLVESLKAKVLYA